MPNLDEVAKLFDEASQGYSSLTAALAVDFGGNQEAKRKYKAAMRLMLVLGAQHACAVGLPTDSSPESVLRHKGQLG